MISLCSRNLLRGGLALPVAGDAALAGALAGVADLSAASGPLFDWALRLLVLPAILRANNNVC